MTTSHHLPNRGDEHQTPPELFKALHNEFVFVCDGAANENNSLCKHYLADSLDKDWSKLGCVWLNPPYSAGLIDKFMAKAHEEYDKGCIVVALVRFDPSTRWWQNHVHGIATEVRMLKRRVKFVGETSAYNFPSAVVIWMPFMGGTIYRPWWFE